MKNLIFALSQALYGIGVSTTDLSAIDFVVGGIIIPTITISVLAYVALANIRKKTLFLRLILTVIVTVFSCSLFLFNNSTVSQVFGLWLWATVESLLMLYFFGLFLILIWLIYASCKKIKKVVYLTGELNRWLNIGTITFLIVWLVIITGDLRVIIAPLAGRLMVHLFCYRRFFTSSLKLKKFSW